MAIQTPHSAALKPREGELDAPQLAGCGRRRARTTAALTSWRGSRSADRLADRALERRDSARRAPQAPSGKTSSRSGELACTEASRGIRVAGAPLERPRARRRSRRARARAPADRRRRPSPCPRRSRRTRRRGPTARSPCSPGRDLAQRRLRGDLRGLVRLEPREERQRAQRRQIGLRQTRPGADDRGMPLARGLGAPRGSAVSRKASTASTSSRVLWWFSTHMRSAKRPCSRVVEIRPVPLRSSAADEPGVRGLVVEVAAAEADDAERRRRHQLERLARLDAPRRCGGEVERAVDRLAGTRRGRSSGARPRP